ncbi:uncharacterized protein [Diadema setosum]|uniref:uncharacterized protein n=1 Tax=Diadema setosum TaxID=31175 RepID=UPI003B3BCC66
MAEEIQRLLECPMCLELFNSSTRWPKLLPCQHTLCLECMDMLNQGSKLQCPQCRQEHACPAEGPQQLPNNFTMLALLEVQQKSGPSPATQNFKEHLSSAPPKSESKPPAINEGVRNSIALLAKKLQEKSVELSKIDGKEKQTEELFLSVKNQVDKAFEARTRELQLRRDQMIKQLASARQEELAFIQGQRVSAYQYLQKLQVDFSKMRQSLMSSVEPREADLINLLSMCRGYLAQIEHYALNIDQRICNVAFSDPNQQQLSISIQAYGCLNISTDKLKSMQAARSGVMSLPSTSITQSSSSNPFSSPSSLPTASMNASSPSLSTLVNGSVSSFSGQGSPANSNIPLGQSTVTASSTSDPLPSYDGRAFALTRQQTGSSRRLSEPAAMLTGAVVPPTPAAQHIQSLSSQPESSTSSPVLSAGLPTQSQSTRQSASMRHISMESVGSSLPTTTSSSQQPSPAGGDQPPPVPRRPGSIRLSSTSAPERPRSVLLRQNTAPSSVLPQAPPLPPRRNVHIPEASEQSRQTAVAASSTSTGNSTHQWVTFDMPGRQKPSQDQSKRSVVIGQIFEKPAGVHALDKLNNCFAVVDELQHCIMVVNEEGRMLTKIGSRGGGAGQVQFPKCVCTNSAGHLIISDWYNHKVQIWDLHGKFLKQFGSRGQANVNFNGPLGVVCDKKDNIYVCDYNNGCVKVFDPLGNYTRQIGKKGEGDGQFRNPSYITFTQGGELLITDAFKHCVHVFSAQGTYLYRFGKWGTGPGELNCPSGIAVDSQGYIYVANSGNHRIEVFNPSGSYALSLGRHGTDSGLFDEPLGISVTKDGRLVVADSGNRRVQVIWP